MQGCCVELHGLVDTPQYNTKRGRIILRSVSSAMVQLDGETHPPIHVKLENMCAVFCIGLPQECRIVVNHDTFDVNALHRALESVDSDKYYVLYLGEIRNNAGDMCQHFVCVRIAFFEMLMKKIVRQDREPLLRIYIASYSQDDPSADIIFGDSMTLSKSDLPTFTDLSAAHFCELCMILPTPNNIENEIKRNTTTKRT